MIRGNFERGFKLWPDFTPMDSWGMMMVMTPLQVKVQFLREVFATASILVYF